MISFYEAHRVPLRLLWTLIARVRAEGIYRLPAQGGVVLVSNHLTDLDPLLLGALFPRQLHFMAKEELFRWAPLGWWLRQTGTFPVRRGEIDRSALKQAEDLLRAGEVLMIFPEGHRSGSASLQAARSGAALLASRTGCPIVPVAIAGTENLRFHRLHGQVVPGILTRPRVMVRVGQPISLDTTGRGHGRKAAADLVMRRIVSMLPPSYHGVYAGD